MFRRVRPWAASALLGVFAPIYLGAYGQMAFWLAPLLFRFRGDRRVLERSFGRGVHPIRVMLWGLMMSLLALLVAVPLGYPGAALISVVIDSFNEAFLANATIRADRFGVFLYAWALISNLVYVIGHWVTWPRPGASATRNAEPT